MNDESRRLRVFAVMTVTPTLLSTLLSTVLLTLLLTVLLLFGGCVLPEGEPCCKDDLDCVEGARCFEGTCALRCDDDFECNEGELCVEPAGVCREANPAAQLERCPYDESEP